MNPHIEIRNASRDYSLSRGLLRRSRLQAVRDVTLDITRGEVIGVVGESGCGKSTLMRLLLGIEAPSSGSIVVDGRPIRAYGRLERARLIQPIFQDPYSALNPRMSVGSIIAAPLEVQAWGDAAARQQRVLELMNAVGLAPHLRSAFPAQLSGGQRQRVAIARALISEPRILVCDEPTSALDVSVQSQILNLLVELQQRLSLTIVMVTHNLAVVSHIADRVVVMYLGEIVEQGPTDQVFAAPRHPYTSELLRAALRAEPGFQLPQLNLRGEFPDPLAPPSGCGFHPRCSRSSAICRANAASLAGSDDHRVACHHPI